MTSKATTTTPIRKPVIHNDDRACTHHAFGVLDAKGREWGANVFTWTEAVMFGPIPEHIFWSSRRAEMPVGLYYVADVHVTRDGENYGASHAAQYFTTPAEREAYVAKRLAETAERQRAKPGNTAKPAAAPVAEPAPTTITDEQSRADLRARLAERALSAAKVWQGSHPCPNVKRDGLELVELWRAVRRLAAVDAEHAAAAEP